MKHSFTKTAFTFLVVLFVIGLPMLASAQIDGLPSEPDAPIDGGLSLLVAAGVGYGAKKLKEKRNRKTSHLVHE